MTPFVCHVDLDRVTAYAELGVLISEAERYGRRAGGKAA